MKKKRTKTRKIIKIVIEKRSEPLKVRDIEISEDSSELIKINL